MLHRIKQIRPRPHRFYDRRGRLWRMEKLLWLTAAAFFLLAVSVILRGYAVKNNNRQYAEWHAQATSSDDAQPTLARMGMPDGSPITREVKAAQGETIVNVINNFRLQSA